MTLHIKKKIKLTMKNIEEHKGQKTNDDNMSNMLIKTDNNTAVSSSPCLHATNDTEEYSALQLKNIGDKFQVISTKPPTPNQGNIDMNHYLDQYLIWQSGENELF